MDLSSTPNTPNGSSTSPQPNSNDPTEINAGTPQGSNTHVPDEFVLTEPQSNVGVQAVIHRGI